MRRRLIHGRRGALLGASAAVVCCLGTALAACGSGGGGGGYVAVGAAGGTPLATGAVMAPTGKVSLAPLDGDGDAGPSGVNESARGGSSGSRATTSTSAPDSGSTSVSAPAGADATSGGASATRSPSAGHGNSGGTSGGSGGGTATGAPAKPPAGPAALSVGEPERAATDKRWCEEVTVSFRNTGGTAVRSGTVTFGTHIIGALGIDWATIESTEDLPAPIAAGVKKDRTWTVCVDAWRVPLGMHIETRDVSVRWE
ncbi:hypothetical protein ACFVYF_05020 [Streptomyces sp. NPDC058274]|uniref:hypothetical protein n=1 Tax=Streptomyces sp. NPDC058274 TaxID=3346416 RepID=UPI0036EE390C